jgi:hypothetical protein
MTEIQSQIARDFLEEVNDDYVGLWSLIQRVKDATPENLRSQVRETTLTILSNLFSNHLIQAGTFTTEGDFVKWNISPEEVLERIKHEWQRLGHEPDIGDVVWFTADV